MTITKWAPSGVFASVFLVGLASFVLAKKPPKDPPPDPTPLPILYEIEWLPENFDTRARDVEFVDGVLVVVGTEGGLGVDERAFVYTKVGGMMDLTTEVGVQGIFTLTTAACINDVGQIAGKYVDVSGEEGIYVCDRDPPAFDPLPLSNVRRVTDIADGSQPDSGTVVGWRSGSDVLPTERGFAWKPGQTDDDPFLPIEPLFDVTGINASGDVVGRMHLFNYGPIFRYTLGTGELEILSEPSNRGSTGFRDTTWHGITDRIDVNVDVIVAGNVAIKNNFVPARLFPGPHPSWQELTFDVRGYTAAINNESQICGVILSQSFMFPDTGFIFDPAGGYWSLEDLIVGYPEDVDRWSAGDARDKCLPQGISHPAVDGGYGTIVGYKWIQAAGYRGFVLRPLPAPTE